MGDLIARGLVKKNTAQLAEKEMFPDIGYINLEGKTVGNIILSRTKVTLSSITLSI